MWVAVFLAYRFGAVCLVGVSSAKWDFVYGLPQGACLSPVFFNLYLPDMFPRDFDAHRPQCRIVRGRCACVRFSQECHSAIEESVTAFTRTWRLRFDTNSRKCGTLTFVRFAIRDREAVIFGNRVLANLSEYKYLGVIFDQRLTFRAHIERVYIGHGAPVSPVRLPCFVVCLLSVVDGTLPFPTLQLVQNGIRHFLKSKNEICAQLHPRLHPVGEICRKISWFRVPACLLKIFRFQRLLSFTKYKTQSTPNSETIDWERTSPFLALKS